MAFISVPLLVEPPLISLYDEPARSSSAFPATTSLPTSKHTSQGLTINRMAPPPAIKDLIEFEEQSRADKLYDEIYQKNLLRFISSGVFATRKKDVEEVAKVEEEANILTLIDEEPSINGSPKTLIYENNLIAEEVSDKEKPTSKTKNASMPPAKFERKVIYKVKDSGKLVCLSDNTTEFSLDSSEDDSSGSSQANSEPKEVQVVRTVPEAAPSTISGPLSHAERLIDTEDLNTVLSDVVTSDYLAGESSSSEEIIKPRKRSSLCISTSTTHSPVGRTRRLVRINLPYDILHTMQEDPRFDGVCHAWVRRPDFCKFGVNCDFAHDYPPALAKKYGMIAVYVGADGKEVKNAEEFLKLEDVFTKSYQTNLDQGAKIHSPGCYKENCRAFLRNDCIHGDRCWYRHPKTVIEGGKWVTKDVRKLINRKKRIHNRLNGIERGDISDGVWGDRQSSVSPTDSSPSDTRSRITPRNSSSHPLAQKVDRVDIIPGHKTYKAAGKALTPKSTYFVSSEERDEVDITSDTPPEVYYPGSACVARVAAKLYSTKSVPANTATAKISSTQVSPNLLVSTKPASYKPTATNSIVASQTKSSKSNTDVGYNYWGDEAAVDDGADYWKNPSTSKISRMASRQQAIIVEAMTYDQLFRDEPHQEYHRLHKSSRQAKVFTLPPQPAVTHRETVTKKLFDSKLALAQAKQDKGTTKNTLIDIPKTKQESVRAKETLIDIFVSAEPTTGVKASATPHRKHTSILETQSINDNGYETTGSGSDWTKSLKAMLAQKCEPTKWSNIQAEPKFSTLIEF